MVSGYCRRETFYLHWAFATLSAIDHEPTQAPSSRLGSLNILCIRSTEKKARRPSTDAKILEADMSEPGFGSQPKLACNSVIVRSCSCSIVCCKMCNRCSETFPESSFTIAVSNSFRAMTIINVSVRTRMTQYQPGAAVGFAKDTHAESGQRVPSRLAVLANRASQRESPAFAGRCP